MAKQYENMGEGNPKKGSNYDPRNASTDMGVNDPTHEGKTVGPGKGSAATRAGSGRDGN